MSKYIEYLRETVLKHENNIATVEWAESILAFVIEEINKTGGSSCTYKGQEQPPDTNIQTLLSILKSWGFTATFTKSWNKKEPTLTVAIRGW